MVVTPAAAPTRFRPLDRLLAEVVSAGILDAIQMLPALQRAAAATPPDRAVPLLAPLVAGHREDPLSAYLAVHALAAIPSATVDELLTGLLDADAPGLQEHAAWALSERRPVEMAIDGLLQLARRGGFGQMLAELTLEFWSRIDPAVTHLPSGPYRLPRFPARTNLREGRSGIRPGLRVAQVLMQGRIDGDLTAGGSGDGGGLATLQVGLTRELASHEDVAEVFLLTRSIEGEEARFATPREQIGPGATIVRLDFGPDGYVPSAEMWPYRPELERRLRRFLTAEGPFDAVHLRFADVGTFAAARVAHELGIPVFFTLAPPPCPHRTSRGRGAADEIELRSGRPRAASSVPNLAGRLDGGTRHPPSPAPPGGTRRATRSPTRARCRRPPRPLPGDSRGNRFLPRHQSGRRGCVRRR